MLKRDFEELLFEYCEYHNDEVILNFLTKHISTINLSNISLFLVEQKLKIIESREECLEYLLSFLS